MTTIPGCEEANVDGDRVAILVEDNVLVSGNFVSRILAGQEYQEEVVVLCAYPFCVSKNMKINKGAPPGYSAV